MMSVTRVAVILLSLSTGCLCSSYGAPSSYQNQVSGNYNNDYFQSSYYSRQEKSKYRLEQSWITYSNPSSNGIPPDRREFRANENERIVFSYDENHSYGPSDWGRINPNCNGSSQSPVNLNTYLARTVSTRQPLIIDGFYSLPSSIRIENNGHSAALRFRFANEKPIRLIGGPLKVPYIVDNVHWHWGESDYAGSEHLLDARRYSAEVHFVTYNSDYNSLAEASLMSKGIAVLAFFYELDNTVGATDNRFIKLLQRIREPESSYEDSRDPFPMSSMVGDTFFSYLSYKGSLTTPNCNETVTWMVSTKTLKISSEELAEFRQLIDEKGDLLTTNFRPIQRLNHRHVSVY